MTARALLSGLTPARALRAAATAAVFGSALALLPELEDAGDVGLFLLVLSGLAFPLLALGGGVWAFAAERAQEGLERAGVVADYARLAVFVFCVALWTQQGVARVEGWGLWTFALLVAAWRLYCDWPWRRLDERRALRLAAGARLAVERYDSKAEAAPPPAAARQAGALGEPLLVSSGGFRVDRARMIDVLSRFQTADPYSFILEWLRLAVASGATRVELATRPDGLELRFDGRPLLPRWCGDAYAPLLEADEEDDPEAERHRHLSRGLLALLPLGPGAVAVASGSGDGRVLVRLAPKGAEPPEWPAPESGTSVRVALAGSQAAEAAARAREAWGLADAALVVDGETIPSWEPAPGVGERFEQEGVRGVVFRAESDAPQLIRFYHLGAAVPEVPGDSSESRFSLSPGIAARVTYEGMRLDASLARPVEDARLRWAVQHAKDAFARLSSEGRLGAAAPRLRALAYTKTGLGSALAAAVLAFGLLLAGGEARPELLWAAAAVYALVTLGVLAALARWALNRLSGRRNPFRPGA